MSNNTETLQEELSTTQETQLAEPLTGSLTDAFDALDSLEEEQYEAAAIEPSYKDFVEGETVRGIFLGIRTGKFTDKLATANAGGKDKVLKEQKIVVWASKTEKGKEVFINAGANLVKQFEDNAIPMNVPVEISLTGTAKTKTGNDVNVFRVSLLQKKK